PERNVGGVLAGLEDVAVPRHRISRRGVGGLRKIDRSDQRENGVAIAWIDRLAPCRSARRRHRNEEKQRADDEQARTRTPAHAPSSVEREHRRCHLTLTSRSNANASTAASASCAVKSGWSGVTETQPSRTAR